MSENTLYKIEFYVPEEHLEPVKQAMFAVGAGKVGDYDSCAWQVLGQGQYRPGADSKPFQGEPEQLETVKEYKVELVCDEKFVAAAIAALKAAHPYEEVAYTAFRTETFD